MSRELVGRGRFWVSRLLDASNEAPTRCEYVPRGWRGAAFAIRRCKTRSRLFDLLVWLNEAMWKVYLGIVGLHRWLSLPTRLEVRRGGQQ